MSKIMVFDTQNPQKNAFEVGEQWIEIMSRKEPGRYQVKSAPKVVIIPKKKVVVVGKREGWNRSDVLRVPKVDSEKVVSLNPIKVDEPSKKTSH